MYFYRDIQSDFDYKKVVQVLLVSYEVKVEALRNASRNPMCGNSYFSLFESQF